MQRAPDDAGSIRGERFDHAILEWIRADPLRVGAFSSLDPGRVLI
jgi:hypothetical protein